MAVEQEFERIFAAAKRLKPLFDNRFEQMAVFPTRRIVTEALIAQQLRFPDVLGKLLPLMVQNCKYDPAFARLKQATRSRTWTMAPGGTGIVITVSEEVL